MTGLVAVAVLLLGTWGLGTALRLRFVHALPTTVLAIIFALYLAYIAGLLHAAWWVVVVLCVAGGVFGLVRLRRRDTSLRALLPAAPLMAFLVALALVMVFTRGRVVSAGDELRLWGAYPKLLFVDGGLQVGPDSLLMGEMQTYTPGLPLFGYFFAAFNTGFADQRVFLAYGVLAIALLAPVASRVSWQRPGWIVPAGVGMALLPLAYANNADADFYASLFVDPVVGIVLGHLLWLTASGDAERRSWQLRVGLAIAVLFLVKTSALALGAVVLVVAVGRLLLATRSEPLGRRLVGIGCLAAPLALVFATWQAIQVLLGPSSKFEADGLAPRLDFGILREFIRILLGQPEFSPGVGLFRDSTSFAVLDAALLLAICCLVVAHRGRLRRSVASALGMLVVCQAIFLAGLYLLAVGPFDGEFPSYRRYSATMLTTASVLLMLFLFTSALPRPTRLGKSSVVVLSGCLVFLGMCFPLRAPVAYVDPAEAQAFVDAGKLHDALDEGDYPEENPVVALVYRDAWLSHVGHHHSVYYRLLGTGARVDLRLTETRAQGEIPEYLQPPGTARADFLEYLVSGGVRLLVVAEENPALAGQFAGVFDRPPEVDAVYRVVIDGDRVNLRWVS